MKKLAVVLLLVAVQTSRADELPRDASTALKALTFMNDQWSSICKLVAKESTHQFCDTAHKAFADGLRDWK